MKDYTMKINQIAAGMALALVSPLMAVIWATIKVSAPSQPAIFTQRRLGYSNVWFTMYKFRTMNSGPVPEELNQRPDAVMFACGDDPRVTPIGKFLRQTKLDELPQLWNICKGDMNWVGPRPLPARDILRFKHHWMIRTENVKPGLTGVWQTELVHNEDLTFGTVILAELCYNERRNWKSDLRILAKTFTSKLP